MHKIELGAMTVASLPRPNDATLHYPHGVTFWFDTNEQRAAVIAAFWGAPSNPQTQEVGR